MLAAANVGQRARMIDGNISITGEC